MRYQLSCPDWIPNTKLGEIFESDFNRLPLLFDCRGEEDFKQQKILISISIVTQLKKFANIFGLIYLF